MIDERLVVGDGAVGLVECSGLAAAWNERTMHGVCSAPPPQAMLAVRSAPPSALPQAVAGIGGPAVQIATRVGIAGGL